MSIPIRAELEILVGTQPFLRVTDTAFYCGDPQVVGENLDMARAVGTRYRVNSKVYTTRTGGREVVAAIRHDKLARASVKQFAIVDRPASIGGNQHAGLVCFRPQPHCGSPPRIRQPPLRFYAGGSTRFVSTVGKQLTLLSRSAETGESPLVPAIWRSMGDDIAMIVLRMDSATHGEAYQTP